MFPTLWKHIIWGFFRNFFICLFGIILLLLSTKIEEVARFIALGASILNILSFILYQIPYVTQIGIPIAALIAGFSLFSQMSKDGEITAARSSGYSLTTILFPIFLSGALLSILMIFIFDISATSHLASKKLEFDVRENQPLAAFQNTRFLNKHGIALELTGSLQTGKNAENLLLCFPSHSNDRLSLLILKETISEKENVKGHEMTVISSQAPPSSHDCFGSLIVENAQKNNTPITHIHEMTQTHSWKIAADHLPLSVVLARQKELSQARLSRHYQGHSAKKLSKQLGKYQSEPFRRLSLIIAAFTLSFAGAIYGIRNTKRPRRGVYVLGPLLSFGIFIASYLIGKTVHEFALIAIFFYVIPHPILIFSASIFKNRIEHGMEY